MVEGRWHSRLTWEAKSATLHECRRWQIRVERLAIAEIFSWAKHHFKLTTKPSNRTIYRILKNPDTVENHSSAGQKNRKKCTFLPNAELENALKNWVYEMWQKNIFLTDTLIQEKAHRLRNISDDNIKPRDSMVHVSVTAGFTALRTGITSKVLNHTARRVTQTPRQPSANFPYCII